MIIISTILTCPLFSLAHKITYLLEGGEGVQFVLQATLIQVDTIISSLMYIVQLVVPTVSAGIIKTAIEIQECISHQFIVVSYTEV